MSEEKGYIPENCTHDCSTCGSACDSPERGPSFFDRLDKFSEIMDDVGEENILKYLNEAIEEWEAEEAAEAGE